MAKRGAGVVVGVLDTGIAPENPSSPASRSARRRRGAVPRRRDDRLREGRRRHVRRRLRDGRAVHRGRLLDEDRRGPLLRRRLRRRAARHAGRAASTARRATATATARTPPPRPRRRGVAIADGGGADLGTISGVAPEATHRGLQGRAGPGPNPARAHGRRLRDRPICCRRSTHAVIDGVDVINYSIGGGAASSTVSRPPTSRSSALRRQASSSRRRRATPDRTPSTVDHAAPWYTTVAATTHPQLRGDRDARRRHRRCAGGSITVPGCGPSRSRRRGSRHPGRRSDPRRTPRLCLPGSLDRDGRSGRIVVCERGVDRPRREVRGGRQPPAPSARSLVNVTPGSIDLDDPRHPDGAHVDAQTATARQRDG